MLAPGKYPINFTLRNHFKENLKVKPVNWGYGGLSEFTYYRTYSRKKSNGKMEAWEKLTGPQLKEAIEMFRTECDSGNDHLSFDEYQRVVDVHALAEWIEWEYTEVLMLRQQWENTMRAEAEYEAKLDKKYGDGGIING